MKTNGITTETYENFLVDAGAVYAFDDETEVSDLSDSDIIGATRDGNSFTIEQDIRTMEVDGAKGPVKGSRRIVGINAQITANIIEMGSDKFQLALPGSSSEEYPDTEATHDKITRDLQIALEDYKNIALVGEIHGNDEPFIGVIKNGLSDDNIEISTADDDEAGLAITFTAHFDPEDLDTEPWEIYYPKASA